MQNVCDESEGRVAVALKMSQLKTTIFHNVE